MNLRGANALVTGGGSGLGMACARWLLRDGATVTIVGRDRRRLEWAATELGSEATESAGVRWAVCDVTDEAAVVQAVRFAAEGNGLQIVVASAGVGWLAPIATIPVEAWRNVMEVNLTGNFLTLKHAAPAMREAGGGAYTVISSIAGNIPAPYLTPYAAAKAGVDMFVRSAADELGPWGIRVNSVQPGLVPTELSASLYEDPEIRAEYLDNMTLGRVGSAEDVAAAVHFLSGPSAGWITGVCLPVDGGHHLRRSPRFDGYVRSQHGTQWLAEPFAASLD
ncbi:MAG: SDR family oxidoreductase [Sporichthyaceae bacterium]|nr:SDR family oxidoreductase [Sporichthyaceae bacterium]